MKKDLNSFSIYKKVRKPKCKPVQVIKSKKDKKKKYDWKKDENV